MVSRLTVLILTAISLFALPAQAQQRKEPIVIDFGAPKVAALPVTLRAELRCSGNPNEYWGSCKCYDRVEVATILPGEKGRKHTYHLRIRGELQANLIAGGDGKSPWRVGGKPEPTTPYFSVFISDSVAVNYVSATGGPSSATIIDYEKTITAEGGARFAVQGIPPDGQMWANKHGGGELVVPGIPPAPLPFFGQFIQVDILKMDP